MIFGSYELLTTFNRISRKKEIEYGSLEPKELPATQSREKITNTQPKTIQNRESEVLHIWVVW